MRKISPKNSKQLGRVPMNPGANLTAIFCRFEEAVARDDSESDATGYYPILSTLRSQTRIVVC